MREKGKERNYGRANNRPVIQSMLLHLLHLKPGACYCLFCFLIFSMVSFSGAHVELRSSLFQIVVETSF